MQAYDANIDVMIGSSEVHSSVEDTPLGSSSSSGSVRARVREKVREKVRERVREKG
jgi:hypothetical protein